MYDKKMFLKAMDYQKGMFDNAFTIMSNFQDQGEKLFSMAVEKSPMVPSDTLKTVSYWSDFVKKNRSNCKVYLDSNFDKFKDMFQVMDNASPKEDAGQKA
ncbi:MAG: hypothetical protein HQK66_10385 [Desulfamplus sp.]|nr:hypothetical protein [Desulfamplus sp.]